MKAGDKCDFHQELSLTLPPETTASFLQVHHFVADGAFVVAQ